MAFQLIEYQKFNQDFVGHAERCIWEFTVYLPDELGAKWTAQKMVDAHIEELEKQGSKILELVLWEDKSELMSTAYRVDITATASPLWWNIIIVGVLAILAIIAIYVSTKEVFDIVKYIGDKVPATLPIMALAGLGLVALGLVYFIRRPQKDG